MHRARGIGVGGDPVGTGCLAVRHDVRDRARQWMMNVLSTNTLLKNLTSTKLQVVKYMYPYKGIVYTHSDRRQGNALYRHSP